MANRASVKELQSLLQAAAPELDLTFRPMFGGIMGYTKGKPFASLSNVGLAFRFFGALHKERLAVPGAAALQYEPDSAPSRSYILVPPTDLISHEKLAEWARLSASNLKK